MTAINYPRMLCCHTESALQHDVCGQLISPDGFLHHRRIFEYNGYKVKSVMNITDVGHLLSDADDGDDKMAKAAKEQNKTPDEEIKFPCKLNPDIPMELKSYKSF